MKFVSPTVRICFPTTAQTHIMLLNDLPEPSVIQLRELCQIMHVRNDIREVLFQQHKLVFRGNCIAMSSSLLALSQPRYHLIDFSLAGLNAADDFAGFDALKGVDLRMESAGLPWRNGASYLIQLRL
jgi:hypothetical protein